MKTFQKIVDWCKKQIIFLIAIISFLIFCIISMSATVSFPIEYFQKIVFGLVVSCIGLGAVFAWLKFGLPEIFDILNTKTVGGASALDDWQKVKLSMFWIASFLVAYVIGVFAL